MFGELMDLVLEFRRNISNGMPEQARQVMDELHHRLHLPETETVDFQMCIVLMALVSELALEIESLRNDLIGGR